jgi:hypothetical protein
MSGTRIIAGRVVSPTRVELDEPVNGCQRVEVIVREQADDSKARRPLLDIVRELPAGKRTRQELDRQLSEERAAWDER